MNPELPLISIIIPTYNRAGTIERAINSILGQTYSNIDLIVIDDGSSDNTEEVLNRYLDPRIRIFRHNVNMGVTAAKNTGLNKITGTWFTIFDSDDEMVPDAIETMINIPLYFDQSVTAITCNCLDTSTNELSGKGLSHDQYLDIETLMTTCEGEFWGITKTSVLMDDRFNENIGGLESILWYKIYDRSKRYYIHKPLRVYYTEGEDRISKAKYNLKKEIKLYTNLIGEVHFLTKIKMYKPESYVGICRTGLIVTRANNRKDIASLYLKNLTDSNDYFKYKLIFRFRLLAVALNGLIYFKSLVRRFI